MIELRDITVEFSGRRVLNNVSWRFKAGEAYWLTGSNGSGKTTILRFLAGIEEAREPGSVKMLSREGAPFTTQPGMVLQEPSVQIILPKVMDELALGPLSEGMDQTVVRKRVEEWSGLLDIDGTFGGHGRSFLLSGGQEQRLVVASTLVMQPNILLLDEPTSMLDDVQTRRLLDLLGEYRIRFPDALIVCTSHESLPPPHGFRSLRIEDAKLTQAARPLVPEVAMDQPVGSAPDEKEFTTRVKLPPIPDFTQSNGETLLSCEGVGFSYDSGIPILDRVGFRIRKGECIVVWGDNGSGKSTLLDLVGGWLRPTRGNIRKKPGCLTRAVFQHTADTLITSNVLKELAVSLHGKNRETDHQKIQDAIAQFDLAAIQNNDVATLSGGEKRRLALAATLIEEPDLLLLDEPFLGLDVEKRKLLLDILNTYLKKGGALLITAHRTSDLQQLGNMVVVPHKENTLTLSRNDFAII